MHAFRFLVYTPVGHADPALAIAASRAGGIGVFNGEWHRDGQTVVAGLDKLAKYAGNPYGVKLGTASPQDLFDDILARIQTGLRWLIVESDLADRCRETLHAFRSAGGNVLLELSAWQPEFREIVAGCDGCIVKGHEAGGAVGEETCFILLQKLLESQDKPVYVRGGIGLHSASACFAAGAAGVVLDNQLLLMKESVLKDRLQPLLEGLAGNETTLIGDPANGRYVRLFERPGYQTLKLLKEEAHQLAFAEILQRCIDAAGWENPQYHLMPLGQDVTFAADWAKRYGNVAAVLRALDKACRGHLIMAKNFPSLGQDSPLAESHGTRHPIVQGPMTRVSDTPGFAEAVADAGGLPMLALALMRGEAVTTLLEETTRRLAGKPWGIGLLGFTPADLLREQVTLSRPFRPAFAIIAGGRPDQALVLEQAGIPSYLHVPSPRLLTLFLEQGARRFVFEGRECGGHIGPLSSFVLWDTMVQTLLDTVRDRKVAADIHVLFAGGIHDTRSAAMVAALTAPLGALGVKVGILMGSAYLVTREIVSSGSIVSAFQQEVLACRDTVSLETGTGHASRCAKTPFAEEFLALKKKLRVESKNADEIRDALEDLNLGRLRLASKALERDGQSGRLQTVPPERQHRDGMYMVGQVATLVDALHSVADLHQATSGAVGDYLRNRAEGLIESPAVTPRSKPADIAIVGIGCAFPKAGSLGEYWDNLLDKVDAITEIPRERWDWRLYFDPDRHADDKIYSKWGGFLDDMPFDPLRYGLPPKAVKAIDPLQLMTLEVLRQTLDDAGYFDRDYDREKVSVILGASGGAGDVGAQYAVRAETPRFEGELPADLAARLPKWTEDSFAGILLNVAAGRAANRFDFGGVNYTVDAACASSLTAVYQGVVELEDGRSDMVIAGGVDTVQGPFGYLCFSKAQALSPRGRCSTFDTSADGIVISEGIAMVAMKRLVDAERDGDCIYAVIKGIGGSSDGRARSMTAPHPDGQLRALRRAYEKAGYSPATVGLFEAHGTGTVAGDTAELETVTRLLAEAGARPKQSVIGSAKTLIGHTKATAGIAGMIKATLALYHRILPPHSNVTQQNPKIADPDCPLYLLREAKPWVGRRDYPRRAAVSAFGFGGTNFHVTLEEYQGNYLDWRVPAAQDRWPAELLVWRASDRQGLVNALKQLLAALQAGARPRLRDLAFTLARDLPSAGVAAALVVSEKDDLVLQIERFIAHLEDAGKPLPPGAFYSAEPLARTGKLALLFAGQGSQYPNMLRRVAVNFPDIPRVLEQADAVLEAQLGCSVGPGTRLSRLIYPPGLYAAEEEAAALARLTRTEIAQPALGAVEVGLWHLLQRLGLKADMAGGHSYGEYVALYAAGVLTLEDLLRLSEARGRFIVEAAAGKDLGTMAAVPVSREEAENAVRQFADVCVANHNAPRQTILSGPRSAIEAVVKEFNDNGIKAQRLPVGAAFHSPIVAPARDALARFMATVEMRPARFPVYSNTTAQPHAEDPTELRQVLAEHLGRPVEFLAEIEAMYAAGARVFLGVGPKNVVEGLTEQILADRPYRVVRLDDQEGGLKGLLKGVGALFAEGVVLDLMPLFDNRDCRELKRDELERDGGKPPYPAHVWLLNGSGARPINESPTQSLTLEEVEQRRQRKQDVSEVGDAVLSSRRTTQTMWENVTMADNPLLPREEQQISPAVEGESEYVVDVSGRESMLVSYQETMRHFLQVQESVMLAYLNGTATEGRANRLRRFVEPKRFPAPTRVLQLPKAPVESPLAAPAPAERKPVKSVPKATLAPASPQPLSTQPAATPQPPEAAPPGRPNTETITKLLLDIVEERTGYPRDMLALDQSMEADLGIDSIKRVEIVGILLKMLPEAFVKELGDAAGALNGQKTLQGMIDWLSAGAARTEAADRPFEQTGPRDLSESRASLPRYVMQARLESVDGIVLESLPAGVYVIADDEQGVGEALASLIREAGGTPVLARASDMADRQVLWETLAAVRGDAGPVRGFIHLLSLTAPPLQVGTPLAEWKAQVKRCIKSLYDVLRWLADDLRVGGRIVAASGLGGYFGRRATAKDSAGLAPQGGAVGLLKSLIEEWPSVRVKAVDLDGTLGPAENAGHILTELRLVGGRMEVGYPEGRRTIFVTEPASFGNTEDKDRRPGSDWVVLATGGARGITAEVLLELAAAGVTLVLVGRTPLPGPEDPELAVYRDTQDLRRYLVERARREKRSVKPADLERDLTRILRDREIATNLEDLRAAGARIDYRVADVRDEEQVATLLRDIGDRYGRLDGVVHGAGVIDDRLLIDKTPESWDQVFDTKVDSAFLLGNHLRSVGLKFLIFFTSVAGRYGNAGQTDYAAANEIVNRLAWQLHRQWQGKVKVAAINWGPWLATRNGTGMVSPETQRKFEAKGVILVDPEAGRRFFLDEVVRGGLDEVEVVAGAGPWEEHEAKVGALPEVVHSPEERVATYPLLANVSQTSGPRGEIILTRWLDRQVDGYLAQHTLDDVPVFPAAVALEMMAEAAASIWPGWSVNEISELRVLRGIRLREGRLSVEVVMLASSHGDADGFEARLELRPADGRGTAFYRATVHLGSTPLEPPSYQPPLSPAPTALTARYAYQHLLFHGPCLQTVTRFIGLDQDGVLVEVYPSDPRAWMVGVRFEKGWLFDPGIVDSAPQLALVWAHTVRGESALPNRFGRVRRYGDDPLELCHLHFRLHPHLTEHQVKADVALMDGAGRLRLFIEELECTSSPALNRLGGGWKGAIVV